MFKPNPRVPVAVSLAVLITAGAPASAALAPQGVSVTTTSTYLSASSGPLTSTASNPGSVNSQSNAGPGGSAGPGFALPGQPAMPVLDESVARGRASLPGTIGSYSHAGGFSPSGPGTLTADATSRAVTHWVATSNDPAITEVGIDVLAFFDGSLLTARFAGIGAGDLVAGVTAGLNAATASGSIYGFSATASLDSILGLDASANWAGDFTNGSNSSVFQSTVNYSVFIDDAFMVPVNETFSWEVLMSTSAYAVGPFELWAIADFFNTASADLSVDTAGVTLSQVPVPLPPALILLAPALGLLAGRYRR